MEITLEKINVRSDPYQIFLDSLRNQYTKKRYHNLLYNFLKLIPDQVYQEFLEKIANERTPSALAAIFVELARKDMDIASDIIATFIKEDKKRVERGEISSQILPNHIKPIKSLLDANRVPIHWKSLHKLPRPLSKVNCMPTVLMMTMDYTTIGNLMIIISLLIGIPLNKKIGYCLQ